MSRTFFEAVPPVEVKPSDWAAPVSGEHDETKVLVVHGDGICLAVDGKLTGLLPKSDYSFRRKHVRP